MADESKNDVASLLKQGLDAYGDGETSTAISKWREVLALDPQNTEARDFLENADRREFPRSEDGAVARADTAQQDVIGEASRLMASEQLEESLELLQSAVNADEFEMELEAKIELVRGSLFAAYRKQVGDLSGIPTLIADQAAITKFNLPIDAGFLLSLMDGVTDLENLMTVSGMDSFEALRTTKNLIEAGIVKMQPSGGAGVQR